MLKSPPLVATLSDSMRMSPCSWGDIFTWPLRGDRIIGLRQGVAECFTARRLRVSVFSRTAIHAPGGWALIENLPNVLTGDRVTVGLSSTVTPSLKIKLRFSLHERSVVFVAQGCCASHQGTGKNGCASCGGVPV